MKKIPIIGLSLFLVLALSRLALATPAPVQEKCHCDDLQIVATGSVSWFCCLIPDAGAKVEIVGNNKDAYGSGVTGAGGKYRIKGVAKRKKNPSSLICCFFADTLHVVSTHCIGGVVGLVGKSRKASAVALDPCQKQIGFTMPGICQDFTPCGD